jgi:hypothetical protein
MIVATCQSDCDAETMTAEWSWVSPRFVAGDLNGIVIAGSTSESSLFAGISDNRFDDAVWQAGRKLPVGTPTVSTADVNAGDTQTFEFMQPISDVLLYIENFDSNSVAQITLASTGNLALVSASPSISFESVSPLIGTLRTSNSTSNGEGDAVLRLTGDVDFVTIDYTSGDGSNGVFYTFAVPEPSSGMLIGCLAVAAMLCVWRR